jgi:hypothetical protein
MSSAWVNGELKALVITSAPSQLRNFFFTAFSSIFFAAYAPTSVNPSGS